MEYIKVNLPNNEANYLSGNGEGCFALVDEKLKLIMTMTRKEKDIQLS